MKAGDLVKVQSCEGDVTYSTEEHLYTNAECGCWFCFNNSSRRGIILEKLSEGKGNSYWAILFDAGEWRLYDSEFEVISESR